MCYKLYTEQTQHYIQNGLVYIFFYLIPSLKLYDEDNVYILGNKKILI